MPQPVLVVVDVQERLFNAMDAERRDEMVRNIKILGAVARRLGVPVRLTEQYPRRLVTRFPSRVILAGIEAHVCVKEGLLERFLELVWRR
jgi:nicotinamidase-related amidase